MMTHPKLPPPPPTIVDVERYRVRPGEPVRLADWDPRATDGFDGAKGGGNELLDTLTQRLEELQEILYAQGRHKVLIVLQAMDTGGKDGVIRHVFEGVNPAGVRVASFKVPSRAELAHDYLWRVHRHMPGKGEIAIFNRSHYEDVLAVRAHLPVGRKRPPGAVPEWRGTGRMPVKERVLEDAVQSIPISAVTASWPESRWQRLQVAEGEKGPRLYD